VGTSNQDLSAVNAGMNTEEMVLENLQQWKKIDLNLADTLRQTKLTIYS